MNDHGWEQRLRALAVLQENHVAQFQLAGAGLGTDEWWMAVRTGRWELVTDEVIRLAGAAPTPSERVAATVLDNGASACLHGPSALAWSGVARCSLDPVHVARPRPDHRAREHLGVVHILRDLEDEDILMVRGVRAETPERALWAVAQQHAAPALLEIGVNRVGRLADDAHLLGILPWTNLHRCVERLARRGRAGTRVLRAVAAARPVGSSPTETRFEDRVEEVVKSVGRGPLRRQIVVGGRAPIGRVDFRHETRPLVIEANSLTFHSSLSDELADRPRYLGLNATGLSVVVAWEHDVWSTTRSLSVATAIDIATNLAQRGTPGIVHTSSCPWPRDRMAANEMVCST